MAGEKAVAFIVSEGKVIPVEFLAGKDFPADLFVRAGVKYARGKEYFLFTDNRGLRLPAQDGRAREGIYIHKVQIPVDLPIEVTVRLSKEEVEG